MTRELDQCSIQTSAARTVEEPQYATLATQPLAPYLDKEVRSQDTHASPRSIAAGYRLSLLNTPNAGVHPSKQPQSWRSLTMTTCGVAESATVSV